MTSCVWAYSDSPQLFPRLIAVGVSSLCFNLDTAPALVRHGSVNKRSHLASQTHAGLCETWKMSRCDGGQRDLGDKSVISVTYRTGQDKQLNSPRWNHIDRKYGSFRWTLRRLVWFIILVPACEGWQLIQIFSGSISWAAWGKGDQYFSFFATEAISTVWSSLFSGHREAFCTTIRGVLF